MLGPLWKKKSGNEVRICQCMSAEHLIPVPLANRFGGITCLKVCYYFKGKRPYGKSQAHALEVIVKINPARADIGY